MRRPSKRRASNPIVPLVYRAREEEPRGDEERQPGAPPAGLNVGNEDWNRLENIDFEGSEPAFPRRGKRPR